MWSLCYEYQLPFILKLELSTKTKISLLDSLWKRDWGEVRNGLLHSDDDIQEVVIFLQMPFNDYWYLPRKLNNHWKAFQCLWRDIVHVKLSFLLPWFCSSCFQHNPLLKFHKRQIFSDSFLRRNSTSKTARRANLHNFANGLKHSGRM